MENTYLKPILKFINYLTISEHLLINGKKVMPNGTADS